MNKNFTIAIFLSLVFHVIIVVSLIWTGLASHDRAFGPKEQVISVGIVDIGEIGGGVSGGENNIQAPDNPPQGPAPEDKKEAALTDTSKKNMMRKTEKIKTPAPEQKNIGEKAAQSGGSSGGEVAGGTTSGSGYAGAGGTNIILSKIRTKIESAKTYPKIARRMKIEGKSTVIFEINPDGSIKSVKISKSSGEEILDEAAVATVKNAVPLPYYDKPIQFAISYNLTE